MALLSAGCARDEPPVSAAVPTDKVAEALELASRRPELPALPADCRAIERSGVKRGERLDAALVKADAALARQNARTVRCAAWHDETRKAHAQ